MRVRASLQGKAFTGMALKAAHGLAHGVTGGLMAEAQAGSFKDGFIGSAVGSILSPIADSYLGLGEAGDRILANIAKRTAVAAIIGGTASVASGGKFATGALTAGFLHLFNEEKGGNISQRLKARRAIANELKIGNIPVTIREFASLYEDNYQRLLALREKITTLGPNGYINAYLGYGDEPALYYDGGPKDGIGVYLAGEELTLPYQRAWGPNDPFKVPTGAYHKNQVNYFVGGMISSIRENNLGLSRIVVTDYNLIKNALRGQISAKGGDYYMQYPEGAMEWFKSGYEYAEKRKIGRFIKL